MVPTHGSLQNHKKLQHLQCFQCFISAMAVFLLQRHLLGFRVLRSEKGFRRKILIPVKGLPVAVCELEPTRDNMAPERTAIAHEFTDSQMLLNP